MDRPVVTVSHIRRALEAPGRGSSDYDLNRGVRRLAARPLRPASVLVPLIERAGGLNLILTRRAALLKHHPGQVAFPGGKQEASDATPLAAALREAEEEIGLRAGEVEVLGPLDRHETVTDFAVAPFVGLVAAGFAPVIDRAEVDEVFEVPLGFALDRGNFQIARAGVAGAGAAVLRAAVRAALHLGGDGADAGGAGRADARAVTRIAAEWLGAARPVTAALEAAGHQALFVGGCVRNALIGRAVADIDLATDARPAAVIALAEAAGLRAVPTGIEHGTVTVLAGGRPFEVTTFRRDVETFGRRAVVAFTGEIAEDAARRDFTMNALYARADGEVIDPLGGLADLRAGRVRFVGDPGQRIAEDYLRILRFFRIHAWYGDPAGGMDPDGLAACAEAQDGLALISRERVGAEIGEAAGGTGSGAGGGGDGGFGDPRGGAAGCGCAGPGPAGACRGGGRRCGGSGGWRRWGGGKNGRRRCGSRAPTRRALAATAAVLAEGEPPAAAPSGMAWRRRGTGRWCGRRASGRRRRRGWRRNWRAGRRRVFPVAAAEVGLSGAGARAGAGADRETWIASDFRAGRDDLLG